MSDFITHLEWASRVVATWPEWKRTILGAPKMRGAHVGDTRPTARTVVVEFAVSVTVEWPKGVPYSNEDAIDAAGCVFAQKCETNVSNSGIVWARCFADPGHGVIMQGGDDHQQGNEDGRYDDR